MKFDFLENLEENLVSLPEKEKKQRGLSAYPLEADFRIRHNGEIIYGENFKNKAGDKWIDFIFSNEWIQYPKDKPDCAFIIINEDAKAARADIKSEGTSVYLKTRFIEKAEKLWGLNFKESGYVDFEVAFDSGVDIKIAAIPKVVMRGENKGAPDYERRENVTLYPFAPVVEEEETVVKGRGPVIEEDDEIPEA